MSQETNNNEPTQIEETKKPSLWLYASIVSVILVAVIWLVLMPSGEPEKPVKKVAAPMPEPVVETPVEVETFGDITPEPMPELEQLEPEEPIVSQTIEQPEQEPVAEPIIEIEPEIIEEPEIEKDSAWLMTQLLELVPTEAAAAVLNQEDLINNFVVFVDNASRGQLLTSFSPLKEPTKKFSVIENESNQLRFVLDPASYKRYDSHAALFAALPVESSLDIYLELQQGIDNAHQQLGYSQGSFDDKLLRVLDYLIDTPVVTGEIALVAPSAMYQFADPELEELMDIQKLLLRMGPDNQQKVQAKLVEFRQALEE